MMGHFATDCGRKGKGKGKGGDEGKGYVKGKRKKTTKGTGIKGCGTFGWSMGGCSGAQKKLGIPRTLLDVRSNRTQVGHKSAECRWRVAGIEEEGADCQREVAGCGSLVVALEEEEEGTGRWECRSKYWAINAMNQVTFVKIDVMGSVKFVKIVVTGSSRVRTGERR